MFSPNSVWNYKWFDTPNNEDGLKKAFALGKQTGKIGFFLGCADVVINDAKLNNLQKALRIGSWVVPFIGMSTAFTVTQQASVRLFPTMDQKWSFLFGGVAAAGVLGSWFKNGRLAFSASLLFGGCGFAYQYMREQRLLNKGTKYSEQFMFYPDDPLDKMYENRQASHWATNQLDWRVHKNKERGQQISAIG